MARRGVSRPVEVLPPGDEEDEHGHGGERAVVEAAHDVERRRDARDARRDLPGPAAPPGQAACRDEERNRGERTRGACERPDGVGRE